MRLLSFPMIVLGILAAASCGDGSGRGVDAPAASDGRGGSGMTNAAGDAGGPSLRIARVARALDTAMFEGPERAWPGTGEAYRRSQVLLVSLSAGVAYLWNDRQGVAAGEKGPLRIVDVSTLGPEWRSIFHIGYLNGAPTLGLSLDETAKADEAAAAAGYTRWHELVIKLALHEGFHFLGGQSRWIGMAGAGGGSRSIAYPERWEPRVLRAALAGALRANLRQNGAETGLRAAAFWQGRLVAEHKAIIDAVRRTDVAEGTAEYATIVMSALVEHGCAADEAVLARAMLARIDEFVTGTFDGGSEPYHLGVLAGLALRAKNAPGWEARVEGGRTPVDVLLDGISTDAQPDDPVLQAAGRQVVDARNTRVGQEVTPLLERMRNESQIRMPVPTSWAAGSFGVQGFVKLTEEPGQPEVLLSYRARHEVPGSGSTIEVIRQSVIEGRPDVCGATGGAPALARVVTFPTTDSRPAATAGTYTVDSAQVKFRDLAAITATDAMGLTWMCPMSGQ